MSEESQTLRNILQMSIQFHTITQNFTQLHTNPHKITQNFTQDRAGPRTPRGAFTQTIHTTHNQHRINKEYIESQQSFNLKQNTDRHQIQSQTFCYSK